MGFLEKKTFDYLLNKSEWVPVAVAERINSF